MWAHVTSEPANPITCVLVHTRPLHVRWVVRTSVTTFVCFRQRTYRLRDHFLPIRSKIKLQSLHAADVVGEWGVEGIDIFQYGNEHTTVVNML